MESFYANQATTLPRFSEHYRQRGSDLALATCIGHVALLFARRFFLPTAKRMGKELLKQIVPEIMVVVRSEKTPKQLSNLSKNRQGISTKYFTSEGFYTSEEINKANKGRKKTISTLRAPKEIRQIFFPD